jgi:hypothetical protein
MTKTKGDLNISAHWLNSTAKKYDLKIASLKWKGEGMCEKYIRMLRRITSEVDRRITKQITEFKYLVTVT